MKLPEGTTDGLQLAYGLALLMLLGLIVLGLVAYASYRYEKRQ